MKKCDCYQLKRERHYLSNLEWGYYLGRGLTPPLYKMRTKSICLGTREQDPCSCGGDRTKCSFYIDVRKKALMEDKNPIKCSICGKTFDGSNGYNYCPWCGIKIDNEV